MQMLEKFTVRQFERLSLGPSSSSIFTGTARIVRSAEEGPTGIIMELADRAIGFLLSFISLSIFTYYTFWVIILPFVESDHFIHKYFLPQEYAILIPVFAGVALLCFLSVFIGLVMLKSKKKKKA